MNTLPKYDTPSDYVLSAEMLAAYQDTGFLILENYVPLDRCRALRRHALKLVEAFDPGEVSHVFSTTAQSQMGDKYFEQSGDKIRFFMEQDAFDEAGNLRQTKEHSLNKLGHAMHDLDPVFDAFSRTPALAATVACLGLADPVIIQSMYIFKPPRIGGEVSCHQDSTFIYTEPESCIGFWFAMEDASEENGCLKFIPGAHKMGLKERNLRGPDGKLGFEKLDNVSWPEGNEVSIEAKAGAMVIFSGRTPHMSGPNLSDKSRHAYTLHVIDRACHYPVENWLQRSPDLPLRGW